MVPVLNSSTGLYLRGTCVKIEYRTIHNALENAYDMQNEIKYVPWRLVRSGVCVHIFILSVNIQEVDVTFRAVISSKLQEEPDAHFLHHG